MLMLFDITSQLLFGADTWIVFLVLTRQGGMNNAFPDATDESSVTNPAWVLLDAAEEYPLEAESASGSTDTFILHRIVGSVVGRRDDRTGGA